MRLPLPLVFMLGIALAGGGYFVGKSGRNGRDAHPGDSERAAQDSPMAAAPGLVASGGNEAAEDEDEAGASAKSKRVERFRKRLASRSGKRRAFELSEMIYGMSAKELAEAWPDLEDRLDSDPDAWRILDTFFGAWAAKDVEGAVAATDALDMWQKSEALGAIAGVLAETDLEGALALARGRETPDEKTSIFNAILSTVALDSNEEAFALMLKGIDEKLITANAWWGATFLTQWANEDPQAAVSHAMRVPDAALRTRGLAGILEIWGKKEPEAALQWVDGQADPLIRREVLGSLVDGWAQREPEKAAAYALSKAEGSEGNDMLQSAVSQWAQKDLEGARAWVEAIEDPTRRDDARLAFLQQLRWRDPQKAAEMILEYRDSPRIFSDLSDTTWQWARTDPRGAYAWAEQNLPEGDDRGRFLARLIGGWADSDPQAAMARLDAIEDERSRRDAYAGVASNLAAKDLNGAMTWLGSQADGPERDRALAAVATVYAGQDPLKASEWLQGIPEGNGRDLAVSGFVNQIADKDPAGAWEWGATIANPIRRSQTLENIARTMLQQDRATATERIRQSDALSEEAKWRLLDAD